MTPLRRRMLNELQRRNYTAETISGYIHPVKDLPSTSTSRPINGCRRGALHDSPQCVPSSINSKSTIFSPATETMSAAADFKGTKLAIEAGYLPEGMVGLLRTF